MLSGKIKQTVKTLAFRLTIYYAAIFACSMVAAFLIIYFMTSAVLQNNLDKDLMQDVQEFEVFLIDNGKTGLLTELRNEAKSEDPEEFFLRLVSSEGKVIVRSDLTHWRNLESPLEVVSLINSGSDLIMRTLKTPDFEIPVRVIYAKLAPDLFLQIGESFAERNKILEIIQNVSIRAFTVVLVFGGLTGWLIARKALSGVEEITDTAQKISNGDLAHRVPIKSRGLEIEQLAKTFNEMLDRISALIGGIREVTDNISHELRSPLTSMRGATETAFISADSEEDYQYALGNTIEECDRLLEMINTMLYISETEFRTNILEREEINLTDEITKACELFWPLAEEKGLKFFTEVCPECRLTGDKRKIQRLIANFLDNAIKYTPAGGEVRISLTCNSDVAEVRITDTGIGIEESELPHIFDRFYRCDRSRHEIGTGLGLSLAQAIVKAHGGRIRVQTIIGKGSSFILTIPKRI